MNKNNDSRVILDEMRRLLNMPTKKRLTLEGIVFGEDGEEMMGDEQGLEGLGGDSAAGAQENPAMQMNATTEENPLDGDPEITNLITQIRVMTLQGLTKLAENPESAQYELLKKIFLMVDKAVEEKVDPEK